MYVWRLPVGQDKLYLTWVRMANPFWNRCPYILVMIFCALFCWRRSHLVKIFSRDALNTGKSLSFVVSFFTQRTPQTKTNITETTDGFTDGTKSKSRWDFEEFKGFIFFNSIWTVVFYSHPKKEFWGEVARIKWSFEIGPKRHECYILYCYSWRVAAIAVDLPHSYLLALHQNVLKASAVKSIF